MPPKVSTGAIFSIRKPCSKQPAEEQRCFRSHGFIHDEMPGLALRREVPVRQRQLAKVSRAHGTPLVPCGAFHLRHHVRGDRFRSEDRADFRTAGQKSTEEAD